MSIVINTNKSGGGNQNWDNVLSKGGALTSFRSFDYGNFGLFFNNVSHQSFNLIDNASFIVNYSSNNYFNFESYPNFDHLFFYDSHNDHDNFFDFSFDTTGIFNFKLGDYRGDYNGTQFLLNDDAGYILMQAQDSIELICGTLRITRSTVGGVHVSSGQYLPVTVNGANYNIQLFN